MRYIDVDAGRKWGLKTVVTSLLLSPVLTSHATEEQVFSEAYFYTDLPIVFSATRLVQKVTEIPVSMTVIDKKKIRASGATEIPELMRLVPGMQVANYAGDRYFVTYHGRADLYSRNLQVLVDGRSIYDPVIGGVAWSDLPLAIEDINRIEVIRGSNAAAYGSNSYSGVINIITENPSDQHGTLVKTSVSDQHSSEVLLRNAGEVGDLNYRLTLNYEKGHGLDDRHDDHTSRWINLKGDYRVDAKNEITFQTGYSKEVQQEGFEGHNFQIPRDADERSNFQQVKWTHTGEAGSEYSLHFYHNYKKIDDSWFFENPIFALFSTPPGNTRGYGGFSYYTHRYELEFQHTLSPMPELRMVWGTGLRHDSSKSPETLNTNAHAIRNQARIFGNAEWKPRKDLAFNFGAMLEKYEGFSALFSPRVALNYSASENHTFRISHSRAYRMPNVWEEEIDVLFYTEAGTPAYQLHKQTSVPDPEKMDTIEIGYLGKFETLPVTLDVKLFQEHISPVLQYVWDRSTPGPFGDGAGRFENDGRLQITGLEVQLDYEITPRTFIHAVFSHLDASGEWVSRYTADGLPEEYIDADGTIPQETYGILASHRFDNGIEVSTGYYRTSGITWLEPGDPAEAYTKWDMRIGKKFKLQDVEIDVAATVQNLEDKEYQEYFMQNRGQREIFLGVGIKF